MWKIIAHSRVRYPPFESSLKNPENLPIVDREVELASSVEDLDLELSRLPAAVKIGSDDSWIIERKIIAIDSEGVRKNITHSSSLDERNFPPIVMEQRIGWYLSPDPIHAASRKWITFAVIYLLAVLFYQFIEPIILFLGIIEKPLGSIQIGILDYPLMIVTVVPLMLLPIILRITANLRDLKQQRMFLSSKPMKPTVKFHNDPISDSPLTGSIRIPNPRDDWEGMSVSWRAGVLPPAREAILEAHGVREGDQPPPGLSTPLPHYWGSGLSDGTGIGEEIPVEIHEVKGGLFLRPMRISETGGAQELPISGGDFKIEPPSGDWPGSQSGSFVRIHWELMIQINRTKKQPLFWLLPLRVRHGEGPFVINEISIKDGRIEESK